MLQLTGGPIGDCNYQVWYQDDPLRIATKIRSFMPAWLNRRLNNMTGGIYFAPLQDNIKVCI